MVARDSLVQVPADGVRAGVQPGLGQLLAQPQHQLDGRGRGRGRRALRAPGLRLERGPARGLVAGLELVHPGTVHAVALGDLGGRLALHEQGGDDQTGL